MLSHYFTLVAYLHIYLPIPVTCEKRVNTLGFTIFEPSAEHETFYHSFTIEPFYILLLQDVYTIVYLLSDMFFHFFIWEFCDD